MLSESMNLTKSCPVIPVLSSLAILTIAATARSEDWPEFRGPTGQGISAARHVPEHWSGASNIVWKTRIPGEGWSSPILSDGTIFLTTAVHEDKNTTLRVLAVAADTGNISWDVEAFSPSEEDTEKMHQKNSLASPTAIVQDGRVYVHFGHMGTAALDLTGRILWKQSELKYAPVHGNGGSPALVNDLLVFSCDGDSDPFIVALDKNSGAVRWKTGRDSNANRKFSFSTPLVIEVAGKKQIISPTSGFVAAYAPDTGREIWRARYPEGFSVITRPVYSHGLVFVSSSYMKPVLYAIDPTGAKGDVTDTNIKWSLSKGAPNTPSPLVVEDELYVISDSGIATCLDARTGKVHWNERIGGNFSASPVFADGRIYFQNEEGVGTVIKAGKEFEVLAKNDLGERSLASPAIADGAVFLRSKDHLWKIGI